MNYFNVRGRILLLALACLALPGCGGDGGGDDPAPIADPGPGPGPGPDPDPVPDPEPTWHVQLSGIVGGFVSVSAADADHAWVASRVDVYRTRDGGTTWTNLGLHGWQGNISEIQFIDVTRGWMRCSQQILSTSDGGESWTPRLTFPPGLVSGWHSMSFVSATTGWVAEYYGDLFYRTTDGGATWTALELPPGTFPKLEFLDAQNGWIRMQSGEGGKLYATADAGETWQMKLDAGLDSQIDAFDAVSMDVVWTGIRHNSSFACESLRTTDGGATWTSTTLASVQFVEAIEFTDAAHGRFLGNSNVYQTSDGGATWSIQVTPEIPGGPYEIHNVQDLAFVSGTTGWVVGSESENLGQSYGFILKSTTGGE